MTKYIVRLEVEVEGPEWPEDKQVPKRIWDWPDGLVLELEDKAAAVIAARSEETVQEIEVVFE
jgi:hypothetical protein